MIVNDLWIDDEDWLVDKLTQIKVIYNEIKEKVSSGELSETDARGAIRYISELEWIDESPEDYWKSSSYQC